MNGEEWIAYAIEFVTEHPTCLRFHVHGIVDINRLEAHE